MSGYTERALTFRSGTGSLFGILHEPERPADTGIVILVGGPQYRVGSHRMFVQMAREFASRSYPVLRFDFAGMGDSEGSFAGFENLDDDVAAAVGELNAACPSLKRTVLCGLCDGATAAAYFAPTDHRVSGVVLLNPWVHTEAAHAKAFLWHYYPRRLLQLDFWRTLVRGEISVGASVRDLAEKVRRVLRISHRDGLVPRGESFIDRMREALAAYRGGILIVASEKDFTASEFTDLMNSDHGWRGVRDSARVATLDGADHTLSSQRDMRKFCSVVCEWLKSSSSTAGGLAA